MVEDLPVKQQNEASHTPGWGFCMLGVSFMQKKIFVNEQRRECTNQSLLRSPRQYKEAKIKIPCIVLLQFRTRPTTFCSSYPQASVAGTLPQWQLTAKLHRKVFNQPQNSKLCGAVEGEVPVYYMPHPICLGFVMGPQCLKLQQLVQS